jgi:hypothetical protein
MRTLTFWRVMILLATLLCIVMLFAPLVTAMFERLAEGPAWP